MKTRIPSTTLIRTYFARRVDKRRAERPPYRPPDPLINNPNAIVKPLRDENLTFIYRPPPTPPSPFSFTTAPVSPLLRPPPPRESTDIPLPPFIRPSAQKVQPPRASDEVVAEIRRLRRSDPALYSRGKLAKMFGCTETFVGQIAALPKPKRKALVMQQEAGHAKMRERWSERKATARSIRAKRREFW